MTVQEWLVSKIQNTTSVTQYTTKVYPDFMLSTASLPCLIYQDISDKIFRQYRTNIISVKSVAANKNTMETLNTQLYRLFDDSTGSIRESSSNICVDHVMILTNSASGFDDGTKLYYRALDIKIQYHFKTT